MLRKPLKSPCWYESAAPDAPEHASSARRKTAASDAASRRTAGESTRAHVPRAPVARLWTRARLLARVRRRDDPGRGRRLQPVRRVELGKARPERLVHLAVQVLRAVALEAQYLARRA